MSTTGVPASVFMPPGVNWPPQGPAKVKLVTSTPVPAEPETDWLAEDLQDLIDRYRDVDRSKVTRVEWKTLERVAADLQHILQGNGLPPVAGHQ